MPRAPTPRTTPTDTAAVTAYLKAATPKGRVALRKLRAAIRAAAPGAIEVISYGIPAFRLDGRVLIWYAAWKNHTSLYPMTTAIRRAFAVQLKGYKTAKGTVQLPLTRPVPVALVKRLVKARVGELRSRGK